MTKTTYRTISGEELTYETPSGEMAAFLARVRTAVADSAVSEGELVSLVYGRENPLLDQTVFRERGAVTPAVFANPLYHVLTDLIDRKRVQHGTLDVERAEARYTLSVAEAAERAGVSESAIKQAVSSRRLPAWRRGGKLWLCAEDIDAYRPGRRGLPPSLLVRIGSSPGVSVRLKHDGNLERKSTTRTPEGLIIEGTLSGWRRAALIAGSRCWLIEPGDEPDEIAFEGYFVRGRFRRVQTVNNERKARETFRAFKAA